MKYQLLIILSLLLVGCQQTQFNEDEVGTSDEIAIIQPEIDEGWIENEIIYIESLIGIEEVESARLALNDLLFSIDGNISNELQQARINTMITLLEGVSLDDSINYTFSQDQHVFTGSDAVAIAMTHYPESEDIIFVYDAQPSHFGDDQMGYYVALKSLTLIESDSTNDGIILKLFVTNDGSIVEVE